MPLIPCRHIYGVAGGQRESNAREYRCEEG
jgi:hypothetical protein